MFCSFLSHLGVLLSLAFAIQDLASSNQQFINHSTLSVKLETEGLFSGVIRAGHFPTETLKLLY